MAPDTSHNFQLSNFTKEMCRCAGNADEEESNNISDHEVCCVSPCVKQANKASTTYNSDNYYCRKCVPTNPENVKDKQSRSYNILEHEIHSAPLCVKEVKKGLTTYRDHYCGKKSLPKRQKTSWPHDALHFSTDQLATISTYKDHYPRYPIKSQKEHRGELIPQKQTLKCTEEPFSGKSETKQAFKPLKLKIVPPRMVKVCEIVKKPFGTKTTYSTDFKKPWKYKKAVPDKPKSNIFVSKEPFRYTSHYMDEFKAPAAKRNNSGLRLNRQPFKSSTIPMEHRTTYKEHFTFKTPTSKPQPRNYPDRSCKECTKSNRTKLGMTDCHRSNHTSGAGDMAQPQRQSDCSCKGSTEINAMKPGNLKLEMTDCRSKISESGKGDNARPLHCPDGSCKECAETTGLKFDAMKIEMKDRQGSKSNSGEDSNAGQRKKPTSGQIGDCHENSFATDRVAGNQEITGG